MLACGGKLTMSWDYLEDGKLGLRIASSLFNHASVFRLLAHALLDKRLSYLFDCPTLRRQLLTSECIWALLRGSLFCISQWVSASQASVVIM